MFLVTNVHDTINIYIHVYKHTHDNHKYTMTKKQHRHE